MSFKSIPEIIRNAETISHVGKIENIVGMTIEASGGKAAIGDINTIYNENTKSQVLAEVVGFKNDRVLLMPYENTDGITSGSFVRSTNQSLKIPVGDNLRGRIIDAVGKPIDGLGPIEETEYFSVNSPYINPLARPPIREKMVFGIKALDGMITIGKGQRIGIFAGSGVGKSTLLGMIAKNVKADINVIARCV